MAVPTPAPADAPAPAGADPAAPLTDTDIARLLDAFYARVRADPVLGPVFAAAVGTTDADWAPHMAQLRAFWGQVMLRAGGYRGNPFQAHLRLLPALEPAMFDRWLALFDAATIEVLPPPAAAAFRDRARAIARSLRLGLFAEAPPAPDPVPGPGATAGSPGLPPGAAFVRATPVFTEATIPPGLLRRHRTAPGTWGVIRVLEGRLRLRVPGASEVERVLEPGAPPGVVAPGEEHEVAPLGPVRFQVEFHRAPVPAGPVAGS